nr:proline-rich protein 36-like [Aegilops tauschii subsp. strangulata]
MAMHGIASALLHPGPGSLRVRPRGSAPRPAPVPQLALAARVGSPLRLPPSMPGRRGAGSRRPPPRRHARNAAAASRSSPRHSSRRHPSSCRPLCPRPNAASSSPCGLPATPARCSCLARQQIPLTAPPLRASPRTCRVRASRRVAFAATLPCGRPTSLAHAPTAPAARPVPTRLPDLVPLPALGPDPRRWPALRRFLPVPASPRAASSGRPVRLAAVDTAAPADCGSCASRPRPPPSRRGSPASRPRARLLPRRLRLVALASAYRACRPCSACARITACRPLVQANTRPPARLRPGPAPPPPQPAPRPVAGCAAPPPRRTVWLPARPLPAPVVADCPHGDGQRKLEKGRAV